MITREQQGFTLVEIVVALSLVTLIMLGLLGALRTLGNTSTAVSAVSDRSSDMLLINGFLRRALSGARNLPYRQEGQDDLQVFHFQGDAQRLRWVGNFPARHGLPGMHFFELQVEGREPEGTLVLRYLPYTGAAQTPDWTAAKTHTLLKGVAGLELAYQANDSPGVWRSRWPIDETSVALPARVRIHLTAGGRYWPELIYAFSPI
ncbi:MAG: prepilin-type N-terminal cleavage/methylation domain-containing protein [Rhodocyclaceae bacterium]|nr:prepilin-type N-terminal cleavage/methylation domain-containing protein [Rhodocyclaceae bacterium]